MFYQTAMQLTLMKEYNVFECNFQAVDRLKAGALAVEAVTAALVELEVGWLWSIFDNLKLTFIISLLNNTLHG